MKKIPTYSGTLRSHLLEHLHGISAVPCHLEHSHHGIIHRRHHSFSLPFQRAFSVCPPHLLGFALCPSCL